MTIESLKENLNHTKKIIKELYVFTNQLEIIQNLETNSKVIIDTKEKKLLVHAITGLTNQLNILNNSTPELIQNILFYKPLESQTGKTANIKREKLIKVKYKPQPEEEKISLTINDRQIPMIICTKSHLFIILLKPGFPPLPTKNHCQ